MNNNQDIESSVQFFKKNDDFLIVSHVQPDGDTISSSLAVAHILKYLGKAFTLVNQDVLPKKFNYLSMYNEINSVSEVNRTFDFIITVDVADQFRTGDIDHLLSNDTKILNIDHHPTNDFFGDFNLVIPTAAATAEVIFDLVKALDIPLQKELATCIYTGLLTDTGGFRYSNTTSKVMNIAAELLEYNVSPGDIAEAALEAITVNHITLLSKALEKLEVMEGGLISWSELVYEDLQDVVDHDDTEGIVNYTRNIDGVEVGAFFKEVEPETIKVSLRSKRWIDVGAIAKNFGGGGHARAAGFTYKGSLGSIKKELLTRIKESKGWSSLEKQ